MCLQARRGFTIGRVHRPHRWDELKSLSKQSHFPPAFVFRIASISDEMFSNLWPARRPYRRLTRCRPGVHIQTPGGPPGPGTAGSGCPRCSGGPPSRRYPGRQSCTPAPPPGSSPGCPACSQGEALPADWSLCWGDSRQCPTRGSL